MRDDFPSQVKAVLAARVAHRCSNPSCRAPTSGPRLDEDKYLNVGVAAHITAASQAGPRYDPNLTPAERAGIENALWLCQNCAKLIDNDPARYSVQVLHQWKRKAERQASEEVGKHVSKFPRETSEDAEREIEHKLKLRSALERSLLKSIEDQRRVAAPHPYEKFRNTKIIIRSLEDQTYPNGIDEHSLEISGWFRVELFDFYHNGLEVILGIDAAIIDDDENWRLIKPGEVFDEGRFRRISVWIIGCIPYRYIRAYDLQGDQYYHEPHLYCIFGNDGSPCEEVRYAIVGKDEYDWPLDNSKRLGTV